MRVFVAGASGVIGTALLPRLLAAGHHVTATTRRADRMAALAATGAEPVQVDVFDQRALTAAVADSGADVVMHQLTDLAGGNPASNAQLRATGTRNLVDAALAAGVRRIIAQSISWVYRPGDAPARESTPLDVTAASPRRETVAGVAALESAVQELPEWVVLRYGMLYGPGTWFASDGMRAAEARLGKLTADEDITSFVHVADAAAAAVAALRWPVGVVNVVDDEPAQGRQWLPRFCEAVAAPAPPVESGTGRRNGWARGADNQYARHLLGWTPQYPTWRTGFTAD
jgi:nucleoside-diphosphate-sugar epimerase